MSNLNISGSDTDNDGESYLNSDVIIPGLLAISLNYFINISTESTN